MRLNQKQLALCERLRALYPETPRLDLYRDGITIAQEICLHIRDYDRTVSYTRLFGYFLGNCSLASLQELSEKQKRLLRGFSVSGMKSQLDISTVLTSIFGLERYCLTNHAMHYPCQHPLLLRNNYACAEEY